MPTEVANTETTKIMGTAICDEKHFKSLFSLMKGLNDYQTAKTNQNIILIYILLILVYAALQLALLGVNFQSQEFIEENYYLVFHLLEFWAVFIFTLIEAFVLLFTGQLSMTNKFQTGLLLFNIVVTFVAVMMFSIYPDFYEVTSHYIEYSVQILITLVDFVFIIGNSFGKDAEKNNSFYKFRWAQIIIASLVFALSWVQIFIYNGSLPVTIEPERAAHFCEFSTEFFNAMFAFMYAMSNYLNKEKDTNRKYEIINSV